MVHALSEVRSEGANEGDIRRSIVGLDSRCFRCERFEYMCCGQGAQTVSGFICVFCIGLMDGKYK